MICKFGNVVRYEFVENVITIPLGQVIHRYTKRHGFGNRIDPVAHPLKEVQGAGALADYPWPKLEWFDFSTLEAQCDAYEGYAIMTAPGVASPGILQCPIQTLLSDERSLMDLLIDPELL